MTRLVIANAFSVNMISQREVLVIKRIALEEARKVVERAKELGVEILSIVGHEATASLLTRLLGVEVRVNRVNYTYDSNDVMLVFTVATRLPEGKVLSEQEIAQYIDKINVTLVARTIEFPFGTNIGFPARIDDRPDKMLQLLEEVGE